MMCGNGNLPAPNSLVHKLIMLLFFVPFILINGDIGVHGRSSEISAKTLGAPNLVHIQLAHENNEQHSSHRSRRRRREAQQQQVVPEAESGKLAGAKFRSELQPNNASAMERSNLIDNEHLSGSRHEGNIENRDDYENNENNAINRNGEKILSRRRRYLIFPPGSSVQIVYDTYHPILEYSNYLILGITAALAWELPSKPVYLDEELRESYQMGNLPLLQRKDQNVSNIKYTSTNKQPSSTASNSNSAVPNANYYYTNVPPPNKNPFNRYYAVNPNHRFYYNEPDKSFYANSTDGGKSNKLQYYLSYADKLIKEFKQLTEQIPTNRPFGPAGLTSLSDTLSKKLEPTNREKIKLTPLQKHLVHPVFKRESIDKLDDLEKFDLKLHRTSRHKLYQQIETLLKTQGSNGMECVLKTLCETGQRDTNEKPGSMIVELLRAVFTLPEGTGGGDDPKHRMYDAAHQSKRKCDEMFPACVDSIWGPKFHY